MRSADLPAPCRSPPCPTGNRKRLRTPETRASEPESGVWPPDVCEQLQEHSFCRIRLRGEEAELLRELDVQARAMFTGQEARDTLHPLTVSPQAPAGTPGEHEQRMFVGLQRLKHRAIFRVRRLGAGLKMPWPDRTPLRSAAIPVLDVLESLAERLVRKAIIHAGLDPDDAFFERQCRIATRRSNVGAVEMDSSPLDLFWYPNEASLSHISNCTPHYDPGFLAIAIASPDPGFRVWDARRSLWVDGAANPAGPCTRALRDALVFVGESLSNVTDGFYPACCHAVDRHADARLGIVYEMQALGGNALPMRLQAASDDGEGGPGLALGPATLRAGACGAEAPGSGECIATVGASVPGLAGMSVVRVESLACRCPLDARDAGGGAGASPQSRAAAGSAGGCAGAWCRVQVLVNDADVDAGEGGADGGQGKEGEEEGGEQTGREDGHSLQVERPLCSQPQCARCWCRRDRGRQVACDAGGGADALHACGVRLAQWAQDLVGRLVFDVESKALVLQSDS